MKEKGNGKGDGKGKGTRVGEPSREGGRARNTAMCMQKFDGKQDPDLILNYLYTS